MNIFLKITTTLILGMWPYMACSESFDVSPTEYKPNQFLVLCYHAIPAKGKENDPYTISQQEFSEQVEYLRTHGYHFVSLQEILDARNGKKNLPDRAILLSFDDAYISYYKFVVPFLTRQHIPSIVAVVGTFVDSHPAKLAEPIMNWQQIKEVSGNPYVEVVSHSYDLHHAVQYNPVGNVAAPANILRFDPQKNRYETESEYRDRLRKDFAQQEKVFIKRLGFKPRAMVWPYGRYTRIAEDIAMEFGLQAMFTLEWGFNHVDDLRSVHRTMIETFPADDAAENPIGEFIINVKQPEWQSKIIRAVQVDLDLIYDPHSFEQTDKNLGKLIDRLVTMGVNRVYLQAFADPDGDGNVESVYFANQQLPVVEDIFSHAAHQISIRNIEIFAWMPTLAVTFPDAAFNTANRVMEKKDGVIRESRSWYHRLSPFSKDAERRMSKLYEDLASHTQIAGILFQDDAYLNDFEDFHPLALKAYEEHFGSGFKPLNDNENHNAALAWSRFKGQAISNFIEPLKQAVLKYRPEARFARNLYASTLTEPQSATWFAQNFDDYLERYDEVVVMAYPEMEKQKRAEKWLKELISIVNKRPEAALKTVYKLQTFDWSTSQWITSSKLLERMRTILASGGIHLAYYPDNVFKDRPMMKFMRREMSLNAMPIFR